MLHIVNKSPFQTSALESCLRLAKDGSALLLIEDGVYAATAASATEARIREACARLKVYALRPDMDARGVAAKAAPGVTLIDYAGFVALAVEHPTSQSWL
jgi:tRNA 2-thiouridine synthesizing protein B